MKTGSRKRGFEWLEPDEGKPSSPVLRGGDGRKAIPLPGGPIRKPRIFSYETAQARAQSGAAWCSLVVGASRCLEWGCVGFAPLQFQTKGLFREENHENRKTI